MRNKTTIILVAAAALAAAQTAQAAPLATAPATAAQGGQTYAAEAVVESVRQSTIAAQVPGRVTALPVKAGDAVKAGQVLVRIDGRAAAEQADASQAQVVSARARLDVARKELEREQQLFAKQYISQAALDRATAEFKVTEAAVRGTLAQAQAASTTAGLYTIVAPFAGTIADVVVEVGDMAMPGKPLLTVYDPAAMRVVAMLPQTRVAQLAAQQPATVELSGGEAATKLTATKVTVLPAADPVTHTVRVRLELPAKVRGLVPGVFARAYLPLAADGRQRLEIPFQAVMHRADFDAVYVVVGGKPQLRQVRLGRRSGDTVEVLAGLAAGEQVALSPLAAAQAGR